MTTTLRFHLGPVQAFVTAARRTRDIWAGSFLLSWLTARAAAAALAGGDARDLVKPASARQEPIFVAACALHEGLSLPVEPFLGGFPNHFELENPDAEAEGRAVASVRRNWSCLGAAVEAYIFDAEVDGKRLDDKYPEARVIFRSQIGSANAVPYWEIYSIVVDNELWRKTSPGAAPISPLTARKSLRWAPDIATAPGLEHGAFCSLILGQREISGVAEIDNSDKRNSRRDFWADVRAAIVGRRYGRAVSARDPDECLDLRANEFLGAVALVKRLFPLLSAREMKRVIGWNPYQRAVAIDAWIETIVRSEPPPAKNWREAFFRLFVAPTPIVEEVPHQEITTPKGASGRQSAMFWPSTSAVAAAHWIENVQRSARARAKGLAGAVSALGPHIASSERNLFLRCSQLTGPTQLAFVDGAHVFAPTVEKGKRDHPGDPRYDAIAGILADIRKTPLDPAQPKGRAIGSPAPVYAIVRADGDNIGALINKHEFLSNALARFTESLRGGTDGYCGAITENNGVTLYASADEMIALCPVEDALELAKAVKDAYRDQMYASVSSQNDGDDTPSLNELTVSVAITYAHRQVPLTWVMQSGAALLDDVAKKAVGRDGLAIEILDAGGRRLEWAARWSDALPMIGSLTTLVGQAVGDAAPIGGNQFLHDVAETLGPLFLDDVELEHEGRVRQCRLLEGVDVEQLAEPLVRRLVAKHLEHSGVPAAEQTAIAKRLLDISWLAGLGDHDRKTIFKQRMSLNGLKIVRFLAENWRKYLPDPELEEEKP